MANVPFDPATSTDAAALGKYYFDQSISQYPEGYFDTPEGQAAARAGQAWGDAARIPTTFGGGGSWFDNLVDNLQQKVLGPIGNSAINMGALSVPLFAVGANAAAGSFGGSFGGLSGSDAASVGNAAQAGGYGGDLAGLVDNPANYGGGFAAQGIADPSLATSIGNYVSNPTNYISPAVNAVTGGTGGQSSSGGILDSALKYAPLIGAGANVISSGLSALGQSDAATKAGQINADAANNANALAKYMYDTTRADQAPWLKAGTGAINQLDQQRAGGTGAFGPNFGMDQFQADPGYGFRLSEGLKAIERGAASKGGLMSGATLKGLQNYGQQAASQEYQNAYNRYTNDQTNAYNRLAGLAGTGQTANNALASAGANYANTGGNALLAAGNARAGGLVGSAAANASGYQGVSNALMGGYNSYQNQQLLDRLLGGMNSGSSVWNPGNYSTSGTNYGLDALTNAFNYGVEV